MKKKIVLLLVMVLLVTPVLGADAVEVLLIATAVVVVIVASTAMVLLAEADMPDDGIRMVSTESEETMPQTSGFDRFVNVLQYVEVGPTQDNGFFVGGRFRF